MAIPAHCSAATYAWLYNVIHIYYAGCDLQREGTPVWGSHKECPAKNADGLVVRYVMSSEGGGV